MNESLTAQPKGEGDPSARASVKPANLSLSELRRRCHNTVHLAYLFLCDVSYRWRILRIIRLCEPYRT